MKTTLKALAFTLLLFAVTQQSYAQTPEETFFSIQAKRVDRTRALRDFFKSLNSPLEPYASTFVEVADKYGLDYRLLPAIACNESSCGKFYIPSSNNVFGWGIYGNTVTSFASMEEGIETVGKGLAQNYAAKGYDTVEEIAPIYTPPNPSRWANNVNYFYRQIDKHSTATEQVSKTQTSFAEPNTLTK